jgi:hypothetical protein
VSYCAWCRAWGPGPVVRLAEARHVVISDGVNEPHAIAVVEVPAGKTICAAHPTLSTEEARKRWRRRHEPEPQPAHILILPEQKEGAGQ